MDIEDFSIGSEMPKENVAPAPIRKTPAGGFSITAEEKYAFKKWKRGHFLTRSPEKFIWYAAKEGKTAFIKHLVSQGYGRKSLLKAAEIGEKTIAKNLVEAGVNIDVTSSGGSTALIKASADEHTDIAVFLIKAGANLDAQTNLNNTALIMAASREKGKKIVTALIEAGADLDIPGQGGHTAIEWAKKAKSLGSEAVLARALKKKKAEVEREKAAEKSARQTRGWSACNEDGQDMVTFTSYDKQNRTSIKRIFDFNAGSLLTVVTSEDTQLPPTEKLFSEIDPDFLKQAEEKRKSSSESVPVWEPEPRL